MNHLTEEVCGKLSFSPRPGCDPELLSVRNHLHPGLRIHNSCIFNKLRNRQPEAPSTESLARDRKQTSRISTIVNSFCAACKIPSFSGYIGVQGETLCPDACASVGNPKPDKGDRAHGKATSSHRTNQTNQWKKGRNHRGQEHERFLHLWPENV